MSREQGRGDYKKRGRRTLHKGGGDTVAFYLGKPAQALTAGNLTAPDNVINIWKGPAWGDDAATGDTIEADRASQDFSTSDYVAVTLYKGKWYVTCFEMAVA